MLFPHRRADGMSSVALWFEKTFLELNKAQQRSETTDVAGDLFKNIKWLHAARLIYSKSPDAKRARI